MPGAGDTTLTEFQIREDVLALSAVTQRAELARTALAVDNQRLSSTAANLAAVRSGLSQRSSQLRQVQLQLLASRKHVVDLENRLRTASATLSANSFNDMVVKLEFAQQPSHRDAHTARATRRARRAVAREVVRLGDLEERDRTLTGEVRAQRRQAAAIRAALLRQKIAELSARNGEQAKLRELNRRLASLQARTSAEERETSVELNQQVGGIAINPGGMVQPPVNAPLQVREIIAAGNAIATLPYIWGGGHGSFQASGYDCSGSVSYVLAAAGLLDTPEVSGDFESYGDPGPGQWVTIYATSHHVWMEVAGWRFDTVALAQVGTRWSRWGGEFGGFVVRHPPGL